MSWFLKLVICLGFLFSANHFSEAKHQKKLPSAVVIGTVYCDTCFQQDFSKANHFIPGASVEIQCTETGSRGGFRQEAKTNNHGEFKFDLPVSVSKHAKNIRGCSITLLRSNEPFCAVAASATSSSLRLKSRKEGTHIFSAGFFSFKPLKQPEICNQKSNPTKRLSPHSNSKKHTDQLPFPFPPVIPPNPLLPPPSLIPPVLPTPPPSLIPPVLPTPPTPPSLPVPLIPGLPPVPLVPSPPPTPPPTLPVPLPPVPGMPAIPGLPPVPGLPAIPGVPPVPGLVPSPQPPKPTLPVPTPLPPFPFQPTPGLPGVPPAEVSRTSSP